MKGHNGMWEKITGCILVLSLALNFALAGLWLSGGLRPVLGPPGPPRGVRREHDRNREPGPFRAEGPPAGGSVSRAVAEVWHLPGPDEFAGKRRGDCVDREKDCEERRKDCDERASAFEGRERNTVRTRIKKLRDRPGVGGWQIW